MQNFVPQAAARRPHFDQVQPALREKIHPRRKSGGATVLSRLAVGALLGSSLLRGQSFLLGAAARPLGALAPPLPLMSTEASPLKFGPAPAPPLQVFDSNAQFSSEPRGNGGPSFSYISAGTQAALYGPSQRPWVTDIQQGSFVGDCYLDAALGSLVNANSDFVKTLIKFQGTAGGRSDYSVTVYHGGVGQSIAVDDAFLTGPQDLAFGNGEPVERNKKVIWPALLEKAYVKLVDLHPDLSSNGQPGYPGITGGDPGVALNAFTNLAAITVVTRGSDLVNLGQILVPVNNGQAMAIMNTPPQGFLSQLSGYNAANQSAKLSDGTLATEDTANNLINLVSPNQTSYSLLTQHAYTLLQINADSNTVQLYNPWGSAVNQTPAMFWLPLSILAEISEGLSLTGPLPQGGPGRAPAAPPGAQVSSGPSHAALGPILGIAGGILAALALFSVATYCLCTRGPCVLVHR
jgi:hypothetical protein